MKSSKYILILGVLALLSLGGLMYYLARPRSDENLTPKEREKRAENKATYEYKKTTFFVAVKGIKAVPVNITTEELAKSEIHVLESEASLVKKLKGFENANLKLETKPDALIKFLNTDLNAVGLVSVDNLSAKLKALEVNSKFLFDRKVDLLEYPLVLEEKFTTLEATPNISNYSHEKLIKLGHTGAMIPARGVPYWTERIHKGDYTKLFAPTKPLFDTIDFLSGTFEAPVYKEGKPCDSCMSFVGPDKFMEGVKYSGIDLFSLAANHMLNGGTVAVENTQKKLEEAGIKHLGNSIKNNDEAGKPVLVEVNGMKIAYLAFNDTPGLEEWATDTKPGSASISDWIVENGRTVKYEPNEERIKYFLQRAKDLNPDYIFVIMHWGGKEYDNKPLPYTQRLGELLFANGADVILGDHPHWVQEIAFEGEKPVFYSVGNFIFDQMWSIETRQGMTIELNYVDKKLVNFRLFPHQLYLPDKGTVELLEPGQKEYQQTLDRIWSVSDFTN